MSPRIAERLQELRDELAQDVPVIREFSDGAILVLLIDVSGDPMPVLLDESHWCAQERPQ